MMSNITQFPKKNVSFSEFIDNSVTWVIDQNIPDTIVNMIKSLKNERVRSILGEGNCKDLELSRGTQSNGVNFLKFNTRFRDRLVPEFGIQGHTAFLTLLWTDLTSENNPVSIDGIHQRLTDYLDNFEEIPIANMTVLGHQVLESILLDDKFQSLEFEVEDSGDIFIHVFEDKDKNVGTPLVYTFMFNFLPVLLDDCAIRFWKTKLVAEES